MKKVFTTIRQLRWYILFALGVITTKAGADYMGYSMWPWSSDETNVSNASNRANHGGRTYLYHK